MFKKTPKCKCSEEDCTCSAEIQSPETVCLNCTLGKHVYHSDYCECEICDCEEPDIDDKSHVCDKCRNNDHIKSWTVWKRIEIPSAYQILARTPEQAIENAKMDNEWDLDDESYDGKIDGVEEYVAVEDD